jgi:hypothetical protein
MSVGNNPKSGGVVASLPAVPKYPSATPVLNKKSRRHKVLPKGFLGTGTKVVRKYPGNEE